MSPEKVWGVIELYEKELAAKSYPVRQMTEVEYGEKYPGLYVLYCHARWMMQHCLEVFRKEYEAAVARDIAGWSAVKAVEYMLEAIQPLQKAMRWMCYVQGLANATGMYSCNELRDHSRSGGGSVPADSFKTATEEHGRVSSSDPTLNNLSKSVPRPEKTFEVQNLEGNRVIRMDGTEVGGWLAYNCSPPEADDYKFNRLGIVNQKTAAVKFPAEPSKGLDEAVALLTAAGYARVESEDERYERLEKEHLGDPDKKTGIYAPKPLVDMPAAPPKQQSYGASSDGDWDAE